MNKELEKIIGEVDGIREIVLMGYMGSQSHGTYIPKAEWQDATDDKDVMGVMIQSPKYYLGLSTREQVEIKKGEWDIVIYDIKKFVKLLLKNNPNVLGLLYLEPNLYLKITEFGQRLLTNKKTYLSKQCYYSFCGYARGQLHRMEHNACEGYMGVKRRELVQRFGYDTKNASHLIRLLRMGIEALTDNTLNVLRRHDATMLIDIKTGKWSLEQVKEEAERLFKLMDDAFVKSTLQLKPPEDIVNLWLTHHLLKTLAAEDVENSLDSENSI